MKLSPTEAEGRIAVAQAHGTTVAAAWFAVSRPTMAMWLRNHGAGRRPHRPTDEDLARRAPRDLCACPMCAAVRADVVPETFLPTLAMISEPAPRSLVDEPEPWMALSACSGLPKHVAAAFFPPDDAERRDERYSREQTAKAVCRQCDVRRECLDYAVRNREVFGIWGGLAESERGVSVRSIAV